jgi:hypothetical protein
MHLLEDHNPCLILSSDHSNEYEKLIIRFLERYSIPYHPTSILELSGKHINEAIEAVNSHDVSIIILSKHDAHLDLKHDPKILMSRFLLIGYMLRLFMNSSTIIILDNIVIATIPIISSIIEDKNFWYLSVNSVFDKPFDLHRDQITYRIESMLTQQRAASVPTSEPSEVSEPLEQQRQPPYVPVQSSPNQGSTTVEPSLRSGDAPIRLFCSYSHRDERHRQALEPYLANLQRQGFISQWSDRQISPGQDWDKAIQENLETADITLLLVSQDFLASSYAYEKEMERAVGRHDKGEARVIPVIVRPSDWHHAPFAKLQALPPQGKPVIEWKPRDRAWLAVAQGIRKAVQELRGTPS